MYRLLKNFNKEKNLNLIIDRAIHVEPVWILRKFGLFKNINLIYFAHGGSSDFRDFYMSRPLVKHRVKMIFDAFDKVICLYDDEKNYPKEVKKEKLHFIPNPLPFEPSDIEFNQKENIVLSLGRVTKEKGIDTLINAWQKVEQKCDNWKLQIVGDGKDKESFIKLAKKLNIKNIEFLPSTPDVKSYYEKAKIFVIPSLFEGMPMTILESMACKCCVISSKTAGGKKLIENNVNGILFDIGDTEALAKNLIMSINDENIQKELLLKAFEYAKQYRIDNISEKWNEVLV
jgi:glycosyltransferase involved in cell wall biosynthesis